MAGNAEPYKWPEAGLPKDPLCSEACSINARVGVDGIISESGTRPNEDRCYSCVFQDSIQLYMVLDGHDGERACDLVQKHLPSQFLSFDGLSSGDETVVKEALRMAFLNTEREFFKLLHPKIERKKALQAQISSAKNAYEAYKQFPKQIQEISDLSEELTGGTTVAVAVIHDQKLYVANVGDTRVLLCSMTSDDSLVTVEQLSVDHNTKNPDEIRRLVDCGLDANILREDKRVGDQQNSRSIGDYSIKGGYKDVDELSFATKQPGSAEPHISEPVDLYTFRGFLVLMSDGLYKAYESWSQKPDTVNQDIADLIVKVMEECDVDDLSMVAQNVTDKVRSLYGESCVRDQSTGKLDDITLIVKSLVEESEEGETPDISSGEEEDDDLPDDKDLPSYIENWTMIPSDLTYDRIHVND